MPTAARRITPEDIILDAEYAKQRKKRKTTLLPIKKLRRVNVGPHCTFYFESYETMLLQIQEMLFIEKGGIEQLADELAAYNPLIPQGAELVATMMFEINDPTQRLNLLMKLGGVEQHVYLQVGEEKSYVVPEEDTERTTDDGKTSSVHFFHFPLNKTQIKKFREPATQVILGCDHPAYPHMTSLIPERRTELARDFA